MESRPRCETRIVGDVTEGVRRISRENAELRRGGGSLDGGSDGQQGIDEVVRWATEVAGNDPRVHFWVRLPPHLINHVSLVVYDSQHTCPTSP